MKTYIWLTEKSWHLPLFETLKKRPQEHWVAITSKADFTLAKLTELQPTMIFIPHWSYLIPDTITQQYPCVIFHMTDLPYGRGGSPLQNLIVSGHTTTKISALLATTELDAGPIFLKADLELAGTAAEILERAGGIIAQMTTTIIDAALTPQPQTGEVVVFERRKPHQGNLELVHDLTSAYDMIRMLDGAGYPPAFLEQDHLKFEFTNARLQADGTLEAHVRIIQK
jgi:methionyl-tRNA formyltransferase